MDAKSTRASELVHRVVAGSVSIEWPIGFPFPLAVQHRKLNGRVMLVTLCPITFRRGRHALTVPVGYEFDGASIPRLFWGIPGFNPIGKHIWAALLHDWICDHPEELPRVIGDALFVTLLLDVHVAWYAAIAMYVAVRAWSTWCVLRDVAGERWKAAKQKYSWLCTLSRYWRLLWRLRSTLFGATAKRKPLNRNRPK